MIPEVILFNEEQLESLVAYLLEVEATILLEAI